MVALAKGCRKLQRLYLQENKLVSSTQLVLYLCLYYCLCFSLLALEFQGTLLSCQYSGVIEVSVCVVLVTLMLVHSSALILFSLSESAVLENLSFSSSALFFLLTSSLAHKYCDFHQKNTYYTLFICFFGLL